ncbi:MAG: DUF1801 domain-containing protein [Candidatus Dormibacterales bacterium]
MKGKPEIEDWFAGKPAEPALKRVRELILAADPRMAEHVKYGSVTCALDGDMASFVQHGKQEVSVMYHRGGRIKGSFPHLEGSGPSARFMRFADLAEVNQRAAELTRIVKAWAALPASGGRKL